MTPTRIPLRYDNHFDAFMVRFPTVESRFEIAEQLASGSPELSEVERGYTGRLLIASHWGDERPDLRTVAHGLYALKDEVDNSVGEPVVVMSLGSLKDIYAPKNDTNGNRLSEFVQLDVGYVASSELIHGFGRSTVTHGSGDSEVKTPFLSFRTQMPIRERQIITVDTSGDTETTTVLPNSISNVKIYFGAVPLVFDRNAYRRGKQTEERRTFIGNRAVALLTRLNQMTSDESLSDLSFLAA